MLSYDACAASSRSECLSLVKPYWSRILSAISIWSSAGPAICGGHSLIAFSRPAVQRSTRCERKREHSGDRWKSRLPASLFRQKATPGLGFHDSD